MLGGELLMQTDTLDSEVWYYPPRKTVAVWLYSVESARWMTASAPAASHADALAVAQRMMFDIAYPCV